MNNAHKNIGVTFKYKGDTYKKIATDSGTCAGCITSHGSKLCFTANDCEGIIVHKHYSWVKTFKQL